MLDMVRYMVVWNPVIFVVLHFVFHWTGMDHPPVHHGHLHGNGTALNGTAAVALNATAAVNATAANATRALLEAWR